MFVTHLESALDGSRFPADQLHTVHQGRPLWVRYDLAAIGRSITRDVFKNRPPTLWRYRELLPLPADAEPVTLGEGMSPILPCARLGQELGMNRLFVKDESQLPTGSFKSRGMTMAVSMAKHFGLKRLAIPTAGNAGGALAAYGARAGMEVFVFMPEDTPRINQMEAVLAGAMVYFVNGLITDCGRIVREGTPPLALPSKGGEVGMVRESTPPMTPPPQGGANQSAIPLEGGQGCTPPGPPFPRGGTPDCPPLQRGGTGGWFDVSTLKEPYRLEGKKTMGLELAEQLGWRLPDVILYPTGGGTGLIGMWKAFQELRALGWLDDEKLPRMIACQSDGCAPIVRAFEKGERFAEPFPNAHTIASGLRVPAAVGDFMMLDVIRASNGVAIAGAETAIVPWMRRVTSREGISICPETAVCFACLETLLQSGQVRSDEHVVIFNTGAAQKYPEVLPLDLPRVDCRQPVDYSGF